MMYIQRDIHEDGKAQQQRSGIFQKIFFIWSSLEVFSSLSAEEYCPPTTRKQKQNNQTKTINTTFNVSLINIPSYAYYLPIQNTVFPFVSSTYSQAEKLMQMPECSPLKHLNECIEITSFFKWNFLMLICTSTQTLYFLIMIWQSEKFVDH